MLHILVQHRYSSNRQDIDAEWLLQLPPADLPQAFARYVEDNASSILTTSYHRLSAVPFTAELPAFRRYDYGLAVAAGLVMKVMVLRSAAERSPITAHARCVVVASTRIDYAHHVPDIAQAMVDERFALSLAASVKTRGAIIVPHERSSMDGEGLAEALSNQGVIPPRRGAGRFLTGLYRVPLGMLRNIDVVARLAGDAVVTIKADDPA